MSNAYAYGRGFGMAFDADVDDMRRLGRSLLSTQSTSEGVRQYVRSKSYNRAQEAFIIEGWKQARMEAGLSENV